MTKYIYHSEQTKTTCEKCKKNDGKIYYDIKDIPKLPIHPNCKCYIETIEDEKENNNNNPDNKNSNNPANKKSQNNNPQPQNPPCDCKDRISVVQNNVESAIKNLENIIKRVDEANYEFQIFENKAENLYENLNIDRAALKNELGKHKSSCPNFVDNLFETTSSKIEYVKTYNKDIKSETDELNVFKNCVTSSLKYLNDINTDIQFLQEGIDELAHTKEECASIKKIKTFETTVKFEHNTINKYMLQINGFKSKINKIEKFIEETEKTHTKNREIKFVPCGCSEHINGKAIISKKEMLYANLTKNVGNTALRLSAKSLENATDNFNYANNRVHAHVLNSTNDVKNKDFNALFKEINVPKNSKGVLYDARSKQSKQIFNSKEIQEYISKNYRNLIDNQLNGAINFEFKKDGIFDDEYYALQHCKLLNPRITSDGYFEGAIVDYYDFSYRNGKTLSNEINNFGYMMQEKGLLENYFVIYQIREKVVK